jgi:hypothetical protein
MNVPNVFPEHYRRVWSSHQIIHTLRERQKEGEKEVKDIQSLFSFRSYSFLCLFIQVYRSNQVSIIRMSLIPFYHIYIYMKRCHSVCIASIFTVYHDWISSSAIFLFHFDTFFQYLLDKNWMKMIRWNQCVNDIFL